MRREEAAAEAVGRLGGYADFARFWYPPYWVPRWLYQWLPEKFFCSVYHVDIDRKTGIDPVLEQLPALSRLRSLSLSGCDMSDRGAECLESLQQLDELQLSGTKITDAGLEHIAGLSELHYLTLGWTRVTDSGMRRLARLQELENLDLEKTARHRRRARTARRTAESPVPRRAGNGRHQRGRPAIQTLRCQSAASSAERPVESGSPSNHGTCSRRL